MKEGMTARSKDEGRKVMKEKEKRKMQGCKE